MSGNSQDSPCRDNKGSDTLERAKRGDQEAFVSLIFPYEHMIRCVVRRFLRNIHAYEEDDLVNEIILRVYKKIAEFRGNDMAFQYFLRRTARGLCLTIIRKQGKHRQKMEELQTHTQTGSGRPDETYLSAKIQECVQQAIGLLPERFREVVILKDIDGLKYEEIAENLSIPTGTVQSRLGRAREKLKNLFEELHCVEML